MTRALFALLVTIAACQPGDETCAAEDELRAGTAAIEADHRACTVDADCTTLNANLACPGADAIGRCSLIVSEPERDEASAELVELHDDICARIDVSCIHSVDCGAGNVACRDGACTGG